MIIHTNVNLFNIIEQTKLHSGQLGRNGVHVGNGKSVVPLFNVTHKKIHPPKIRLES